MGTDGRAIAMLRAGAMFLLFVTRVLAADAPDAVAKGRYLAIAAGCASCHSPAHGAAFAGGDALATPFGKIYPPNITPDVQTGIGAWSAQEFTRALREGVRRDGASLYPAMPYDHYTKISDADVDSLWRYLRSLPAVRHAMPENTLSFPFNLRAGLSVWQSVYFKPGRFVTAPDKDAAWNRGAYLVEALGHCGACHTPRNVAQASDARRRLTGAQVQGWYAPDISNDPLSSLAGRSVSDLAKFLKSGRRGNTKAIGPMQEVVHDSLRRLSGADLHAMAVFLKDQPGDVKSRPALAPEVSSTQLESGKRLFEENCVSCHRPDGKGLPGGVPALAANAAVTAYEPFNVVMAMLEGFDVQGSWGAMGSFADVLNDQQMADVANYVRSAWGNVAGHAATERSVAALRATAASAPAGNHAALICPILPAAVLAPALRVGAPAIKQAARDGKALQQVVSEYVAAQPRAPDAQVIEALSTAYCRAIAADTGSRSYAGARMAAFSQQVATVLVALP